MPNVKRMILAFFLIFSQLSWAMGDSTDAFQFLQEEATVITASRREQSISDVPMAVDVITSEEIKASGATNIWDLLRFRVGMDVVDGQSVDGNRAIVAVRGFAQEFVNDLQVLLDGRSVYQPTSSGVYWDQLPVQMQDIDRIEIIRGPNAALYGSGAALGVINIITKKPQSSTTAAVQTLGGSQGTVQSAESLDSSIGKWAYRLSTTYRQQDGFPSAAGGTANDFLHSNKANLRTEWAPADGSNLELFTGGSWNHDGVPTAPQPQTEFTQHFEMLKFSQKFGEHSTLELLSSRNDYIDDLPGDPPQVADDSRVLQYDEEILDRLDWWESRMNTTYGVNYRNAAATSAFLFAEPQQREEFWSGYFNQSIRVAEKLSLSGGVSWEGSNVGAGGVENNYQMASLWTPWSNQTFRASYSVAHTVPSLVDAAANITLSPVDHLEGNPDLDPEKVTSYEVGYRGTACEKHLEMDSSLYYTKTQDINSSYLQSIAFTPEPLVTLGFEDVNQAIARGIETEVKYRFSPERSIYLNYTYEHVTDWLDATDDVTKNTPAHKVNFGGMTHLGHGFSGSLNVGYKDSYFIGSDGRTTAAAIPAYWRLDARLAYAVNSNMELFVAGQNLAASTHLEFADGLTVPRTYQGGMSIKFGGSR